jgi:tetratricopeptide (TPR) repeat protein
MGPNRRHSASAASLRPDLGRTSPLPDGEFAGRPAGWIVVAALILGAVMIAGVVAIWKTGAWSPEQASAAPVARTGNSQALAAALDSARVYSKRGEWSKAEAVLRKTAEQYPMDQDVHVALAESLIAQKKAAQAYEQYEKALAIGPREPKLEYSAGVTASTAGLIDRAEEHFSMAQAADPLNASYPLSLGMVQRKLGQLDAAKASLLRAANIDPENAFAWGTLADIALGENNLGLALQHIVKARTLQPDSKEWRLIEARARKRKGEPEKALALLLPMDISQRHEPVVARQIAECYGMLGRAVDGAHVMGDASNANPTDAALAYDAAAAFEHAGDKPKALEFAKRAKMLGNADAAGLIDRLR